MSPSRGRRAPARRSTPRRRWRRWRSSGAGRRVGGRGGSGGCVGGRGGAGRCVRVGSERGEERGADRGVESGLRCGYHRKPGVLGKPLCDKGNTGAATDDREGRQTRRRYPVAFGQFVEGRDDAVQRRPNQILQFVSASAGCRRGTPRSSTTSWVAVSAESRSLASRHSSRSLVSDSTAAVPAGSTSPARLSKT